MAQPQFAEVALPPIVAEPPDCTRPLGQEAQCIVLRHFGEMLAQREAAWHSEDIEAVHRLRVAARRTRTALQTFATLWEGKGEARRHLKFLGEFADTFNAARDLDVLIEYLRGQLKGSSNERSAAIGWLLERNMQLREQQRPALHKALRRVEKRRFAEKFVEFFSHNPVDLWPRTEETVGGAPARPEADPDASSDNAGRAGAPPSEELEDRDTNGPQ